MSGDKECGGDWPSLLFPQAQASPVRQRAGLGQCQKKDLCKGAGVGEDPSSKCLIPCTREPPQKSAPCFGTPNEGLLGYQGCLFVFGLLAFAAVLRDRLF